MLKQATFLIALSIALTPAAGAETLTEQGRRLAEDRCSSCHAVAGPGPSPVADAPAFSTFGRRWPLEALAEALAEGILVPHPSVSMPEFVFSPREIDALLAYLQSVQE